jgi:hypothetical protein
VKKETKQSKNSAAWSGLESRTLEYYTAALPVKFSGLLYLFLP